MVRGAVGIPWFDFDLCRGSMAIPNRRGPRALADILGELFAARGYGRSLARQELEDAWSAAVGEPLCRQTHLGEVRRGVLNVSVSHPALLEELAAFRKAELLTALRQGAPGTTIHDIRFRVGLPAAIPGAEADPKAPNPDAAAGATPASTAHRRGAGSGATPGRRRGPARG
jgi:predicted nucleic acid-binding Zn ribbon protein